jgi:hypothetical protein
VTLKSDPSVFRAKDIRGNTAVGRLGLPKSLEKGTQRGAVAPLCVLEVRLVAVAYFFCFN